MAFRGQADCYGGSNGLSVFFEDTKVEVSRTGCLLIQLTGVQARSSWGGVRVAPADFLPPQTPKN